MIQAIRSAAQRSLLAMFGAALLLATPGAFAGVTATSSVPVLSFPATAVAASGTVTATVTFTITGYNSYPGITYHYGTDYATSAETCDGQTPETCTLTVKFKPTVPGVRKDAVFVTYAGVRIATVLLSGVGTGPLAALQPGVLTQPAGMQVAGSFLKAVVADENGVIYFYNSSANTIQSCAIGCGSATTLVSNVGNIYDLSINGAGVLYWGQASTVSTAGTIVNSYDTVLGVQGTVTTPASDVFYNTTVDGAGNIFVLGNNSNNIYKLAPGGTSTTTALSPAISQPYYSVADSQGDLFLGGFTINELTAGGTQTQVSTNGNDYPITVDAANTLYTASGAFATEYAAGNYAGTGYALPVYLNSAITGMTSASSGTLTFGTAGGAYQVDRSQNPLAFGTQTANVASSTKTVNVVNIGNQSLTYTNIALTGAGFALQTASTSPCTPGIVLAAGANCNVAVNFTGPHAGSYSGNIVLTSNSLNNAASTQTIAMTATIRGPYITASPNPLVFPNQTMGTTSSVVYVTIANNGYDPTTGLTLSSSNPAFSFPTSPNTICTTSTTLNAAGQPYNTCQLYVTFSPTLAQNYSGTITVTGLGGAYPNSAVAIPVSGNGSPVVTQTAGGTGNVVTFPNTAVGATSQPITASFLITGGTTLLSPTASLHYGTSYSVGTAACVGSIGAQTCTVPVTFKPGYPGGRREAIFLTAGGVRVATALVYGVGTSPLALLQPGVITNPTAPNTYYYNGTVDENGTAYVLSTISSAVYSVTKAGVVTLMPINELNSPRDIGIDGAGVLYISDQTPRGVITTYDTVQGVQGSVPFNSAEFYNQGLAVGNTGNLYLNDSTNIYTVPLSGSGTAKTTAISPQNIGNTDLAVDNSENLFIAGQNINELTPAGVQTQVNTSNGNAGIAVDAAGTLYSGRYGTGGIGELAASNYSAAIAYVDSTGAVLGLAGVTPDGTVYAGDYTNIDKVDRSQGLFTFNSVNANQAATPQVATIYNGGNTPLTVASTTLTGDVNYLLSGNGCTSGTVIPVGGICTVTVNFTAPHNGIYTGALTFVTNSLNTSTTNTIALTDTVTGGYLTLNPTTLAFGTVPLNTASAPMYITVSNSGGSAANIQQASATNPRYQFTIPAACNNIAIGGSCQLSVVFTPNVSGAINATASLYVTNVTSGNNAAVTSTITLTGTGGPAAAAIATYSTTSLNFTPPIGTTSPAQIVTLSNTGNAPLTLTNLYISGDSGDFSLVASPASTCTSTTVLAGGASCSIAVSFTTASYYTVQPYSAIINIADSYGTGYQSVALTGTPTKTPQLQFTPAQVTAIAGTGALTSSGTGDNGPALSATFAQPFAVAQDPSGNTYVVDYGANYVRKIAPNGTITQFAGQVGYINHGFSGDGGAAINAQLNSPDGIAVDQAGNVYIADEYNGRIRVVNATSGIISTYAGSGVGTYVNGASASAAKFPGPVGLTFDPSGNLYIAMGGNGALVVEVTPYGTTSTYAGGNGTGYNGDNILATAAQLSNPYSVASDQSGNIYIADNGNSRVRKVTASTGKITTVAGNGTDSSTGDGGAAASATVNPYNVAVNLAGDVFIEGGNATLTSFSVRKITANGAGSISTVAGGGSAGLGGPATSANFNQLEGIGIDNNGSLLITTYGPGTSQVVSAGPAGFLQFPSTTVGATSAFQVVTLENTGNGTLTLPSATYTATGPFTVTGGSCDAGAVTLGVGANGGCTIAVTFTPTAATNQTGTITVASNGTIPSQTIYLQGTGTAAASPTVSVTPSSLTFTATVNGTSATQNVTITNTGTTAVTGPTATITGSNGFSFNVPSTSCTGSLPVGSSCVVGVNFSPSSTNTVTASLSLTDNAAGNPQTVSLSGTGTAAPAPAASLSPTSLSFTATTSTVAYNQSIALSNTGAATLTISSVTLTGANPTAFALLTAPSSPCGGTLAAGATCNLYVSLASSTVGTYSANVVVTDNASPSTQVAVLSGTVNGVGLASFAPASLNFPATTINTTATAQTLVLTNTGTGSITGIGPVTLTGAGASAFAQTNNCLSTLAAGASCSVNVTFTPGSATLFAATVSITDSVGTQTANLGGTGAAAPAPQAALTPTVAFPATILNVPSSALTATLTNAGTAALPITSASVSGPFTLTANGCGSSLAAGASCTYSITFTPTATGAQTGTLRVIDSVGTQTTTLTGTGAPIPVAQAVLSPTTFTFPSTFQGTPSAAQVFTLSNSGTATLTSIAISFTGANPTVYSETTTCGTTLAAAGSCTISVIFTPTAAATYTANLSVANSVATQVATLSGTGNSSTGFTVVAPNPTQTVDPGQAAVYNINVNTLTGNYTLPVTLSATGLPPGATYTFSPATVVPGTTGAPTVLTVQTSPSFALLKPLRSLPGNLPVYAALLLLPLAGMRRFRRKLSPALRLLALVLLSLAAILPLSGCGGGYFGQGPQSFTITVTGTSTAATQSTTVTLTLQ